MSREDQRSTYAAVLSGDRRGLATLESVRRAEVLKLARDVPAVRGLHELLEWSRRARAQLKSVSRATPELDRRDFERFGGVPTSLLRRPKFLSTRVPATSTALIRRLVARHSTEASVASVFERSDLSPHGSHYETFHHPDGPAIRGQDGRLFRHLAAISHELGHCLRELSIPLGSLGSHVESEAGAQYLEEALVDAVLRGTSEDESSAREWWAYQRRIDALNHHFASLDWADLNGETPRISLLFERRFCFLRPSYLDRPGAEIVYAAASALRELLAREADGPCVEFTLDRISGDASWLASWS